MSGYEPHGGIGLLVLAVTVLLVVLVVLYTK